MSSKGPALTARYGINPAIFREYDIRGLVGQDLTPGAVETLGKGFGAFLAASGGTGGDLRVLVGRDNRRSSDGFADSFSRGLSELGFEILDIGTVLTPMLYYARVAYGIDGAAMVTGSHNPPEFNGFKLCHGPGTIYGRQIQEVSRIISRADFAPVVPGRSPGRRPVDLSPAYQAMLLDKIQLGPRRLKVVVDCGNGTAGLFAPEILGAWGCEVVPLYCASDPDYPHHHPDPVKPENLRDLQRAVRENGADLGIAYDGDGDRIGVVDEAGEVIWGDILMALFWREVLARHPGSPAIIEVKCSQALVEEVQRLGGRPMFYKTGHSLIKAKMREVGAVFTGEMSGHMFFADEYYGFDDAVYASGRLLRLLSNTDEALSSLAGGIPRYCATPEVRVDCPDAAKFRVVEAVKARFQDRLPVVDVDGVRVLFPDGWGLVRASNTQPALVVRCEARTPAGLEGIQSEIMGALEPHREVGPIRWD